MDSGQVVSVPPNAYAMAGFRIPRYAGTFRCMQLLSYRYGLSVLRGVPADQAPEWLVHDPRVDALVGPGHRFAELRAWAQDHGIADQESGVEPLDAPLLDPRTPRDYQQEAVDRWRAANCRGSVVLPTGAGKTLVALLAIHSTAAGACIVVPTRALVAQWFTQLADAFGATRVGAYYGDEKEVRALTVTTYHSAFQLLERWGEQFPLLVLDEVHHLADTAEGEARAWHDALRVAPSPFRLGLTATYPDGRDAELRRLVGGVAYRRSIGEMTDAELARFAIVRRYVRLSTAEESRYAALSALYEGHLNEAGYRDRTPTAGDAWRLFAAAARRSPVARRAFRAFHERERVVRLAEAKLQEAERILGVHSAEQAVLFCGGTDAALAVSRALAIPVITAATPASERHHLLQELGRGAIRRGQRPRAGRRLGRPERQVGIVLGDSTRGSQRQHVRRAACVARATRSRRSTRLSRPTRMSSSRRRSAVPAYSA